MMFSFAFMGCFAAAKLLGLIDAPWVWVTVPFLGVVILLAVLFVTAIVASVLSKPFSKRK